MTILKAVLTVLLAACGAAAAASPVTPFTGSWKGMVTVSPNNCVWDVTGQIREKAGYATGNFSYSGPCDRALKAGTFSGKPSGGGCYSASVSVPGLPPFPLTACIGPADTITFDSLLVKGTLKVSEEYTRADLASTSMLGSANGIFQRAGKAPAAAGMGKAGKKKTVKKKVAKDEQPVKKIESPEILIGGY